MYIDTLMWQPSLGECVGRKCLQDCYVRKAPFWKLESRGILPWIDALNSKSITVHSLILSVQDQDTTTNRNQTLDILGCLDKKIFKKKVDLTAYSIETLPSGLSDYEDLLNTISLSNVLPIEVDWICNTLAKSSVRINFNYLVDDNRSPEKWDSILHCLNNIRSSTCNFILKKPPLGGEFSQDALSAYDDAHALRQQLKPSQLRRDRCYHLAVDEKCSHACGAGIQFAHIWPNGSLTACPYDSLDKGPHSDASPEQALAQVMVVRGKDLAWNKCQLNCNRTYKFPVPPLLAQLISEEK